MKRKEKLKENSCKDHAAFIVTNFCSAASDVWFEICMCSFHVCPTRLSGLSIVYMKETADSVDQGNNGFEPWKPCQ